MQTQIVFDVISRIIQSQYLGSIFLYSVLAQFTQLGLVHLILTECPDDMFLFRYYRVFDNEKNIAIAYYFHLFSH